MESLGSPVQSSTPSRPMSQKPSYRPTTRKSPAKLKAMEINRNSIKGSERAAVFAAHVDLHNPDIIFGCESKLDHDVPTQASFPHGYAIYRKERTLTGGGGIFMAVKSSLPSSELASPHSTTKAELYPYGSPYTPHKQKNYIFVVSTNRHLPLLRVLISLHNQSQHCTDETRNHTHI